MRYEPIWYGWDLLLFSLFPFFNFNKNTQHTQKKKNSRTNSFVTFCYFFNLFSSWLFFLSPTLHETLRLGCRSQTLPTHHYETRPTTNKNTKKNLHDEYTCFKRKNTRLTSWYCRNCFGYIDERSDPAGLVLSGLISLLLFVLPLLLLFMRQIRYGRYIIWHETLNFYGLDDALVRCT